MTYVRTLQRDTYVHTLAGILEVSGDAHIMYSMVCMYMNLSI